MLGTIVARWTGRGRLEDLADSVREILRIEGRRAKVLTIGRSVVVDGVEPASVANLLGRLPGIDWLAVGRSSERLSGLAAELARLARNYLKPRGRFVVRAEATDGKVKPSDLAGAGTSAILDAVSGSRVSEAAPSVTFRVAFDGSHYVAAVELCRGAGGAAMGRDAVYCLVSGGKHSSALAWAAMLSGHPVRMVHVKTSEDSLLAVARLYAELSQRVDPRKLDLTVIEGEGTARAIARWSEGVEGAVYAGLHSECHKGVAPIARRVESPLYLLPEEWFDSLYSQLGLRPLDQRETWKRRRGGAMRALRFGGWRGDVNDVLAGLRGPRRL